MRHLLKSSMLTFITVVLGVSLVYDVMGQPIEEKKKVIKLLQTGGVKKPKGSLKKQSGKINRAYFGNLFI